MTVNYIRMMLIDKIKSPQDLKILSFMELKALAEELRWIIIERVSKNGGHLSANLGVVELTIAMHYVFNCPHDKFIWDVGHQAYSHKLLTGRYELFSSLRKFRGLSGFPRMAMPVIVFMRETASAPASCPGVVRCRGPRSYSGCALPRQSYRP